MTKLSDRLITLFSKTKVQKQLFSIFFAAILIPVAIIGVILLINMESLLLRHYNNQVESDNLRVKSILFDVTTNIYNISEDLATDTDLRALLSSQYSTDVEARSACGRYQRLDRIFRTESALSSLTIYTINDTIPNYGQIISADEDTRQQDWFLKASSQANVFWRNNVRTDQQSKPLYELTLYRKILLPNAKSYAVLAMSVSNNYLKNRIENNTLSTVISLNRDPIFYGSDRSLEGTYQELPIDYAKSIYEYMGEASFRDSECLASISTLTPYQSEDSIYIATLNFQAYPYISRVTLTYSVIILLILVVPSALIYLFTRYFSARVGTLRGAMHQASSGDYDIIDSFNGDDELSEAFADLKAMIGTIQAKEAQVYQAQIKEQEIVNQQQQMEFKMLASQINPHFLYNTLETIRMKALKAGNREVATAIKLLGKSMRYVLANTGTASTTLGKELDYIKTYLTIQQLRFHDRVNFTIKVQDGLDTEDYQILPLLLQPIVENAILHGLEGVEENGKIIINIRTQEEEFLCIDIFDNGSGMDKDGLEQMTYNIYHHDKTSADSIGLYNINQRIQLCYGPGYGLTIKSRKGEGTLVSLTLPLHNT